MASQWGTTEEEINISKFNPALFKMRRLHEINSLINFCKLNPLAFNSDYNEYNYILWIKGITNLFHENSKLTDDEKKKVEEIKTAIEQCLNKHPIVQIINNREKKETKIDMELWNIFKKHIEIYENKVKEYADKHGLDTPNEDEQSLF